MIDHSFLCFLGSALCAFIAFSMIEHCNDHHCMSASDAFVITLHTVAAFFLFGLAVF